VKSGPFAAEDPRTVGGKVSREEPSAAGGRKDPEAPRDLLGGAHYRYSRTIVEAAPSTPRRTTPLPTRAWQILLAGLLLREAFSFWTGHPFDFESWVRTGYVVSQGTNPYSAFWPPVPGVSFAYLGGPLSPAAYLPFWPLVLGELYRTWLSVGGGDRFILYLFLKQPGILADVGSAYLLYRLVETWKGETGSAIAILTFWSFFPYAIIITAIWGQFDSIIVLLLLVLLYARTPLERSVLYGLGIFVKWLTVIFLPLEVFRDRGTRRLFAFLGLAIPGALTVLVFVAEGWSFVGIGPFSVSQAQGEGQGMNYAYVLTLASVSKILSTIPNLATVGGYLWVPGVVAAGWLAAKWLGKGDPRSELRATLLVVTVFLLLRWGLYEQYFLYLFSLLALDVAVFNPGRRALLMFTVGLATVDLLINNDLGLRFLSPLNTGLSSYTTALDANDTWGVFRTYALLVLALVVTVTLVQLVRTFHRDQGSPRPWFYRIGDRLRGATPTVQET
jgi:hypothetical protein